MSNTLEHTVGSHSDDRGGTANFPCYCQDSKPQANTLDEILPCISCGTQGDEADGFGNCTCGNERLRQQIQALITEARIDAVYSMHDSIMRGELQWGNIREDAWLNGTIHKWIDRVIESGDTTSTSRNGKWIQAQLTKQQQKKEAFEAYTAKERNETII